MATATEGIDIAALWPLTISDACAQFFTTALRVFRPAIRPDARVLEIGCAEFDWLSVARKAWPQMDLVGIDTRSTKQPTAIKGDVMTHAFEPNAFDLIVSISAIEHVGLGHYGDPKRPDGDTIALERAFAWLKPGGWLYFDVPWNSGTDAYEVVNTSHRVYDDERIQLRLRRDPWKQGWRGVVAKHPTDRLLTETPRLKGGDHFYYCGFWWQKPTED